MTARLRTDESLYLYRKLVLIRQAEEKIREEYGNDGMKTPVHLSIGQEAIPVGVLSGVPEATQCFGTYRNHALYLMLTDDTDGFFAELYGKATGAGKGKAGSMHLSAPESGLVATSAVVGTTIPLAVGAAFAAKYKKSDDVAVAFFGDGAVEEGSFWESMNFACLHRLRILFVCEDNNLAIHTPSAARQGFRSISEIVGGFECYCMSGDGSDVQEVIMMTRQMVEQMSEQPKPGFLHLTYLRFLEHVGIAEDFDVGYRLRPASTEMARLDPVLRFEKNLLRNECSLDDLRAIRTEVDEKIARSIQAAKQAPFPAPSELYTDVFV
ncbi:MAG: acetoin dehydrogenase [Nitrospiraceae bacterium]|jgi:pyruvate dehydrogenase E1 component alpha subunit|nr:acetoin dehydrogenase [Nitrospiraceae bacterium]